MNTQINQLIEQIKLDLDNYQSQLSNIDLESNQEKERLLEAIKAEEADIKSLLSKYRYLRQQNEIDAVRSTFNSLSSFKRNLLAKIDSESNKSDSDNLKSSFEQKLHDFEAELNVNGNGKSSAAGDLPKKSDAQSGNGYAGAPTRTSKKDNSHAQTVNSSKPEVESTNGFMDTKIQVAKGESSKAQTINRMLKFIDSESYQNLAKLYPANVAKVVPEFNVLDVTVREHLIKYYQKRDRNVYNALIKLYQKPTLKQEIAVPETQSLNIKDRRYHDFIAENYINALPFFWFLVTKEANSIRYAVMECAKDHIIYTNEADPTSSLHQLNLNFAELLELNNGASLETYLRDIFICFHPQRVSTKSDSKNKYFDYINNLITQGATLENSHVLKFWSQMKQFGYQTVVADDFPVKD